MLILTNDEIAGLIRGEKLARFPPVRSPTSELESFYSSLVNIITRNMGCADKTEWNHYGSGYASYVDAWFYFKDGRAQKSLADEDHFGIYVLLSRLSYFYVVGQGEKSWNRNGTGGSYLPHFDSIDSVEHPALLHLERVIDVILSGSRLKRLRKGDPVVSNRERT